MTDFYGVDIALDNSGGILLERNDFRQVNGADCVVQQATTRLFTPKNGLFYDPEYGSDLHKFINCSADNVSIRRLNSAIRITLEAEPLIVNESIEITISDNAGNGFFCKISFGVYGYDTKINLVAVVGKELKIWRE